MITRLKIIAIVILLWMIRCGISHWMTPVEFAINEWANKTLIAELDEACKESKNYNHCFGIWLAISKAESQMGNKNTSHGYFGRVGAKDKSTQWFVKAYNKYYYKESKYNEWGMFYWYWPKKPAPTSYCTSEESSKSVWYCPNGRWHFNSIYLKYAKEFNLTEPTKQPQIIENKSQNKQKPQIIRKKRVCRSIILTIDKGEYLELSFGWKIRRIIRELWYGDELRICKDI